MRLLEQYREMHRQGHFRGHSLKAHIPAIRKMIERHHAGSLLDYGCGSGEQWAYPMDLGGGLVTIAMYDPASDLFSHKPALPKYNGVICTDVLEHIPEDELQDVLKDIYAYAEKFVFFSVCTRPAKKCLPDGQNCHVTVKPEDWWLTTIHSQAPIGLDIQVVFT